MNVPKRTPLFNSVVSVEGLISVNSSVCTNTLLKPGICLHKRQIVLHKSKTLTHGCMYIINAFIFLMSFAYENQTPVQHAGSRMDGRGCAWQGAWIRVPVWIHAHKYEQYAMWAWKSRSENTSHTSYPLHTFAVNSHAETIATAGKIMIIEKS